MGIFFSFLFKVSLGFVEGLNNKIGYLYHRLLVAQLAAYGAATQKSGGQKLSA